MEDKTIVGVIMGILAVIFMPITYFITSAGLICIPFVSASYTLFNSCIAFLIGFGTGCSIYDGTYEPDSNKSKLMEENVRRRKQASDNHRFLHS